MNDRDDTRERLQALVPEQLIRAYSDEALVHAVFTHAAISGSDRETALIELVLTLVDALKQTRDGWAEHLQRCPGVSQFSIAAPERRPMSIAVDLSKVAALPPEAIRAAERALRGQRQPCHEECRAAGIRLRYLHPEDGPLEP